MNTIKQNQEIIYKVKNSNFISYCYKLTHITDVNNIIENLNNLHPQAKHICYSYRLVENDLIKEYYYESTEPHGTSGMQIFNILTRYNIVNCLIVVVRYFGGTKLGIGLLSRSYISAAKNVIENNLIEYKCKNNYELYFPNKFLEYIKKICLQNDIEIKQIKYIESNVHLFVLSTYKDLEILLKIKNIKINKKH